MAWTIVAVILLWMFIATCSAMILGMAKVIGDAMASGSKSEPLILFASIPVGIIFGWIAYQLCSFSQSQLPDSEFLHGSIYACMKWIATLVAAVLGICVGRFVYILGIIGGLGYLLWQMVGCVIS